MLFKKKTQEELEREIVKEQNMRKAMRERQKIEAKRKTIEQDLMKLRSERRQSTKTGKILMGIGGAVEKGGQKVKKYMSEQKKQPQKKGLNNFFNGGMNNFGNMNLGIPEEKGFSINQGFGNPFNNFQNPLGESRRKCVRMGKRK